MKILIDEFGRNQFVERVIGCSILYEGKPCWTRAVARGYDDSVDAQVLTGSPEKPVGQQVIIPFNYFTDENCLKYPQLGYRTAAAGQFVTYMTRIPTAVKKGLHVSQVRHEIHRLTKYLNHDLGFNFDHYQDVSPTNLLIFNPNILSPEEGLAKVRAKEIISFIVDENFLCVPAAKPDALMEIHHRQRKVGEVTHEGEFKLFNINAATAWAQAISRNATRER